MYASAKRVHDRETRCAARVSGGHYLETVQPGVRVLTSRVAVPWCEATSQPPALWNDEIRLQHKV